MKRLYLIVMILALSVSAWAAGPISFGSSGSGDVATDTIFDAAGDLVQGTGANTAAKLTKGAEGTIPRAGAASLAYTPYTIPATVPTVGKVLISDGTNLIGSTALGSGAYATVTGTNTGDETAQRIGTLINGLDAKTAPVDADYFGLMDSETGNILKKFSYAYMKSLLWGSPTITGMPSISAGAGNGGGVLKLLEDPNNGTDYSSVAGAADAGTYPSWTWGGSQGAEAFTMTLGNNSVTYSSSTGITSISFGAINLVTTGTVSGKIPMITKSDDYTLGTDNAQEAYGYIVWMSGANKTLTLPAVAAGMSVVLYSTDAEIKRVDPNGSDGIRLSAARDTDGDAIACTAAIGAFICLVADGADGWTVMGKNGTWAAE